ncbi:hypothetical protein BT67DRAFT_128560 [Trichocladium antarcticum]|uniref:Uncharacterized protein n=1 Tax=Trichocladium antarcticum TaxID=1450529 RepID=A0AAN6ZGA0_9PEZI|nr:hypothetical protein BT67DRAFT_128560 [Trichocladium antarcticum]
MSKRCKRTTFKYTVTSVSPRAHQTEPPRLAGPPDSPQNGRSGATEQRPESPHTYMRWTACRSTSGPGPEGFGANGIMERCRTERCVSVWPTLRQWVGSVRRTCGAWGMAQRFKNNCPSVDWKLRQKTSSLPWSQTSGASMYFVDKLQNNAITWHHARGAGR